MYAIVDIGGKQFHVTQKMRLKVPRLDTEPGKKVQLDRVLLYEDDKGNVSFGDPLLKNINIDATLISHGRDKKVIVFKKKRRKGYRVKRGHRQDFSLIEITGIGRGTKAQKAETKIEDQPQVKKAAAEKAAPDKAKKAPTRKTATRKKSTTTTKTVKTGTKKASDEKKTASPAKTASTTKKAAPKKTATKSKTSTAKKKTSAKKSSEGE